MWLTDEEGVYASRIIQFALDTSDGGPNNSLSCMSQLIKKFFYTIYLLSIILTRASPLAVANYLGCDWCACYA